MGEEQPEKLALRTLEDISTLILHSHDLQETLDNIVNLVARRTGSDVCSIYLLDDDGRTLTLQASKGLHKGAVGRITMKTSEGLTGLVLEQKNIVSIENAPAHPRYKYFKETGEERFHSFLGIPLLERKTAVGVIVVQTKAPRVFTPAEVSTLSTIACQISSIVINAKLLDFISRKEKERAYFQQELEKLKAAGIVGDDAGPGKAEKRGKVQVSMAGIAVSPGFCWGKAHLISRSTRASVAAERPLSPEEERKRFYLAQQKVKIQTIYMEKRVAKTLSKEDASIFHTHLMILEDRTFGGKISDLIDHGYGAAGAVRSVVDQYVEAFSRMEDPYLRQRSADMEDIGRRLIDALDGNDRRSGLRTKKIIVADEILPSDMARLDPDKILGIITEKGDANSHASIMARSLGIPAVLGLTGLLKKVSLREEIIIDGNSGHVYLNPDTAVKTEYERLRKDYGEKQREMEELRDLPAMTLDGFRVTLRANIGLISDVKVALANGAEGVGLYRTEFPYMTRKTFPDRQEQFRLYRRILEEFSPFPVNIRTLDIGGDKGLPYFTYPKEDNPFMGWRSIRFSLERRDIFIEQLAGILMASPYGDASIMLPMVSGIDEIRAVREIIGQLSASMKKEGVELATDLRLGMMVEVPAAVQTAAMLVREIDYFSIGTNDLIQYTLAADRNNPKVRTYYDPFHPAVLHSVKHVADVAASAGKSVSVCGEMAADPLGALILIGLGISELSMSAPAIPVVKQMIRKTSSSRGLEIAKEILRMGSCSEIREYLADVRGEMGLSNGL